MFRINVLEISTILWLFLTLSHAREIIKTFTIGVLSRSDDIEQLRVPPDVRSIYEIKAVPFNTELQLVTGHNSLEIKRNLCSLFENKTVISVIDTQPSKVSHLIQAICLQLKIPYITVQWMEAGVYSDAESDTHLNLYPDSELLSQGIGAVVRSLQWTQFAILFDNDDALVRLKQVLKFEDVVLIEKIEAGDESHKTLLKKLKRLRVINILIDGDLDTIQDLLIDAKEIKMLEPYHNYLLTSLDSYTLDLKGLAGAANVTTISIFDKPPLSETKPSDFWHRGKVDIIPDGYSAELMKTDKALAYDAISLLRGAITELTNEDRSKKFSNVTCMNYDKVFVEGPKIISSMKDKAPSSNLITGPMEFEAAGQRTDFRLFVKELEDRLIAVWNPKYRDAELTDLQRFTSEAQVQTGRTYTVVSRLGAPYLMLKDSADDTTSPGNERFEGYMMDLLNAISNHSGLNFSIYVVDGYGTFNQEEHKWKGLIGEVLENRADLAAADLTITPSRQEVVDFSMPFLRLGLSLLYKEVAGVVSMFDFLNAFTPAVWSYTATLYLTVSIVLYFVSRMAPGDWENPHPCDQTPEELENSWNIKNCLWLTLGSIMNQGCDLLPKGISSRMVASMWWFFALMMTNSYTASLAAFLTTSKMLEIKEVEDLAKQNKIKYGTVSGGSTENFFRQSAYSPYKRMYASMKLSEPPVFESTIADGVRRVKANAKGLYAFLMESTNVEYIVERDCELRGLKKTISPRTYGIAMKRNSPLRDRINSAILHLQERGFLIENKNKWWRVPKNETCKRTEATSALTLDKVGGVFMVLGCGLVLGLLLGFVEFLIAAWKVSVKENESYWSVVKREFWFALNVWVSKKRTQRRPN